VRAARIDRVNREYWRDDSATLIKRRQPPVNIVGGYRFPDAPNIDISSCRLASVGPYQLGIAWILRYAATMSIWCGPRLAAARTRQGAEPGSRHRIQGSFVKVILDKIGDDELIAYVPDRVFYRDPFSIGDVVIAGWEKDKTRMLARN
jgi:hypothetical protein